MLTLQEIYKKIFILLDTETLRETATLVCKEWHDFIKNDPHFSSHLIVKFGVGSASINTILKSFPKLKRIELQEMPRLKWHLQRLNFDFCPDLEKVVIRAKDDFNKEIFESNFENEDFLNCMDNFKIQVPIVAFHPKEKPRAFTVENINKMVVDLDNALLEAEDFDIDDFGTKLGKNLEEIRVDLTVHDWPNTIPYDPYGQLGGTFDLNLFLVVILHKYLFKHT